MHLKKVSLLPPLLLPFFCTFPLLFFFAPFSAPCFLLLRFHLRRFVFPPSALSLPVCHGATHIPFPPFLIPPPLLLLYFNVCVCVYMRVRGMFEVAQLDIDHCSPHLPRYSSLPPTLHLRNLESLPPSAPEEIMRCQCKSSSSTTRNSD